MKRVDWDGHPPDLRRGGVLGGRSATVPRPGRHDPIGAGGLRPQPDQGRRGRGRGHRQRHGGGAGAEPLCGAGDHRQPAAGEAIAHAHVKTDKIDAGVLASLRAAGFLPEVWVPDAETERRRRLVARRNQVVRHRTRVKNEIHAILAAHLVPPCPHAEPVQRSGARLARQAGASR